MQDTTTLSHESLQHELLRMSSLYKKWRKLAMRLEVDLHMALNEIKELRGANCVD